MLLPGALGYFVWKEDMLRMKSYGIGVIRVADLLGTSFEPEEGRFDDSFWDR